MTNAKIISCGSYLPKKIVTNSDLAQSVDTSDEWIVSRTGIKQRHIAVKNELTSDISVLAAQEAIEESGLKLEDIDMVIVATTTPDLTFPSTATIVQSKLGLKTGFAFDVQAVCSGFVYALNIANNFIKVGQVKNALVIGADTLSKIVDWKDRNTCVLFGDGAGAVILSATEDKDSGILANNLHSNGQYGDILNTTGGIDSQGEAVYITMAGKEVFKHAVEKMSACVLDVLGEANLTIEDVDLLIPHQANARILTSVAKKLNISEEKVIVAVDHHANTSAASIPLAMNEALKNGRIKKGDIVVVEALGGGLTWGSAVMRW